MEKQLDFFLSDTMLRSRRPPEAVRRSRVHRVRSTEAEALAPAIDSAWFELLPLEAYAMCSLKPGPMPDPDKREAPGDANQPKDDDTVPES